MKPRIFNGQRLRHDKEMEPKAENGDAAGKTNIANPHLFKMQLCEFVALGNLISKYNLFVESLKTNTCPLILYCNERIHNIYIF